MGRLLAYAGRHHLAAAAIFLALGGTAVAVSSLPSGRRLRGVDRAAGGQTAAPAGTLAADTFTFVMPLTFSPAAHLVLTGAQPPSQCPGSATSPAAAPGNLCVYEAVDVNATGQ